jgi:glutathione reductase (NADPH)
MSKVNRVFDLVVIGTGVAASTVAWKCHSAGWKIAVIDSRPFGGTCALRGCDPKKVLVGAAEVIDWNHRMGDKGINNTKDVHIKWPELMRFKQSFTEPVPKAREDQFSNAGIDAFHGHARFTDATTIKVTEEGGNDHVLNAKRILVATGAKPAKLNIPGEEHVTISDQFLELDYLPERIVFIGGGYISFEFAHIAARAGAKKITILHRSNKPLVLHAEANFINRDVNVMCGDPAFECRASSLAKRLTIVSSYSSSSCSMSKGSRMFGTEIATGKI